MALSCSKKIALLRGINSKLHGDFYLPSFFCKKKQTWINIEKLENKYLTDKRYGKVRDHCHYTENIEVLHIGYVIQNIVYLKIFL